MGLYALAVPARVLAIFGVSVTTGILVCQAVALVGMAGGRLVAALVDRPPGFYPWLFCALEVVMAAGLWIAA